MELLYITFLIIFLNQNYSQYFRINCRNFFFVFSNFDEYRIFEKNNFEQMNILFSSRTNSKREFF